MARDNCAPQSQRVGQPLFGGAHRDGVFIAGMGEQRHAQARQGGVEAVAAG